MSLSLNTSSKTLALSLLLALLFATESFAQFSIEIGLSRDKAVRKMLDNGYEQIEVYRKGFSTMNARACKNGIRYDIRVSDGYRIKHMQSLGPCAEVVNALTLGKRLEGDGFSRVVVEEQNGKYVAIACKRGKRQRLIFASNGDFLDRRVIGQCRDNFEPNDVRKVLQDQGYNRIKFTDRQLPVYVAEACKGGRKFEIVLNRFAETRSTQRIGRCAPQLKSGQLAAHLEGKGYSRIEIIDDQLPGYQANACAKGQRYEIFFNRFGDITGRNRIGKCRQNLSENQITDLLKSEGFSRIKVDQRRNGNFEITACFKGYERFATLSSTGRLLRETEGRQCPSRSVNEIMEELTNKGHKNPSFFVESCNRRGNKVRIEYNQIGDRLGREVVGKC